MGKSITNLAEKAGVEDIVGIGIFAKLIVEECVKIAENYQDGLSRNDVECFNCRKVAYSIADRIRETFTTHSH
jgi:hypothetical protein